ncbi:FoF1 ATP synthase subunit delta [Thermoproteota archaeon]
MKQDRILAGRYLRALISAVPEQDVLAVVTSLKSLIDSILSSEQVWTAIKSPIMNKQDKRAWMTAMSKLCHRENEVEHFLQLLIKKNRTGILPYFPELLQNQIDRLNNLANVIVVTASKLDEPGKEMLLSYLQALIKKKLKPEFRESKAILGGFKLFFDNIIYDGSLKTSLTELMGKNLNKNL